MTIALLGCAAHPSVSNDPFPSGSEETHRTPEQRSVLQTALSLMGTPYRYGGATPKGFDCSGFVKYVYHQSMNIALPRQSRDQARAGKGVFKNRLHLADLVYFKIKGQRSLHIGIYIGKGKFIHAPSSGGKVNIQNLKTKYWKRSFIGARRIL